MSNMRTAIGRPSRPMGEARWGARTPDGQNSSVTLSFGTVICGEQGQ